MRAGRLRRLLTLQQPTETRGASGGVSTAFADVATVWGAVEPLTTKELLSAGQVSGEITHRVVIRWKKGITDAWRIKDVTASPALIYSIHGPPMNINSKNQQMTLMCSEGIDNG